MMSTSFYRELGVVGRQRLGEEVPGSPDLGTAPPEAPRSAQRHRATNQGQRAHAAVLMEARGIGGFKNNVEVIVRLQQRLVGRVGGGGRRERER